MTIITQKNDPGHGQPGGFRGWGVAGERLLSSGKGESFGSFRHPFQEDQEFPDQFLRGTRILTGDDIGVGYGMAFKISALAIGRAQRDERRFQRAVTDVARLER